MAQLFPVVNFSQESESAPRNLFVCGLHRSGTTLIADTIARHPSIASLTHNQGPENEGEFVQSVLPRGDFMGGPGRFAFASEAHLTEHSPLATEENARKIMAEWSHFHQPGLPWLVEKSPYNILRMRLLQALYPQAKFVIVMRHPIAVTLATQKWTHTSPFSLIAHWLRAHQIAAEDLRHLRHKLLVRYEDFVADPHATMARVWEFLELPPHEDEIAIKNANRSYFLRWQHDLASSQVQRQRELRADDSFAARCMKKLKIQTNSYKSMLRLLDGRRSDLVSAIELFEAGMNRFGYSLTEPLTMAPVPIMPLPSSRYWTGAVETVEPDRVALAEERNRMLQSGGRAFTPSAAAVAR